MARYYFHTVIGPVHIHDYYGSDLPDEGAARRRAIEDIDAVWTSNTIRSMSALHEQVAQLVAVAAKTLHETERLRRDVAILVSRRGAPGPQGA